MKKFAMFAMLMVLILLISSCGNKKEASQPPPQSNFASQENSLSQTTTAPPVIGSNTAPDLTNAPTPITPPEIDTEAIKKEADAVFQEFFTAVKHLDSEESYTQYSGFYINFNDAIATLQAPLYAKHTDGTEEDWYDMSFFERFIWHETYLKFLDYISRGSYDYYFGSEQTFINGSVSPIFTSLKTVVGTSEAEAYRSIMLWQYNHFRETASVFNFMTGQDYLERESD